MKKYFLAVMFALAVCGQANASFVEHVTGGDMAGIVTTVEFADGSSESAVWVEDSPGSDFGHSSVSDSWILYLFGDTFGMSDDDGNLFGVFAFESYSAKDIVSVTLEMLDAGFVFDTEYFDVSANGSDDGREFVASEETIVASYSDWYMDELFGTMTITSTEGVLVEAEGVFQFMTDTDMIVDDVPAPAGIALFLVALMGFRFASRKA